MDIIKKLLAGFFSLLIFAGYAQDDSQKIYWSHL